MAKRIPVSFKENKKDLRIYNRVIDEGDQSYFIKKALEFYIDYIDGKSNINTKNNEPALKVSSFDTSDDDGIGEIMGI